MTEPRSDSHSSMAQLFGQQVTFLNTSSLEDTADFYGTKLSLPLVFEQPGFVLFYQVSRDSYLGICRTLVPGYGY